jgi:hypothetical protein
MVSTGTLTVIQTTKKVRFTDTTDYVDLGFDLSAAQMKGLGTIYAQGEILVQLNTVGSPLIDLQSGATYYEFDAVLDNNGDIAQITYQVDYALRMAPTGLQIASTGVVTTVIGDGNPEYAQFLEAGDTLVFDGATDANRVIDTVDALVSGNPSYTLTASIDISTPYDGYGFDVTRDEFSTSWTYAGCTLLTASADLVSDCAYGNNGTFSVTNETAITTETLVSLQATINYPSWTGEAAIVVTSLPYTNNRLATGTYSVVLSEVLQTVASDGLIIQYTATSSQEFTVRCAQPLCNLNACIENLRAANAGALQSNKVSQYQVYVDNVNLYWIQAQNELACGNLTEYQALITLIEAELDSSGCDCGCCDEDDLRWVFNTSEAAQDAIEQLQTDVLALQNPTVYNMVIYDSVFPLMANDGVLPNNPNYFRPFTDISEITIAKEYFAGNDNGYPKNYLLVEIGVWTESNSYTASFVNAENSTNIAPTIVCSAVEGESRLSFKIFTYQDGTSQITQVTTGEGFTIDNGQNPNVCTNLDYEENYGLSLWDVDADLVLDFTPTNTVDMGFTYFKITAIAIP